MRKNRFAVTALLICISSFHALASEVIEETPTQVIIREHPKTGRPYVAIVPLSEKNPKDPFTGQRKFSRPDYRMLDPTIKKGSIPYDGPYSDRKKVYILAASLATVGTVGGVAGLATAPAATGTAASGGAGAYFAGGAAVAGGSAAAVTLATKSKPKDDNYIHRSESKEEKKPEEPIDNP